jgi:release factor glutamine methyltransferase
MTQEEEWLLAEKYDGEKTLAFFADRERLHTGEPLAFVIGHVPFLSAKIYLDSRPLIPRVETEFWVDQAIKEMAVSNISAPKVLDLCAGSGCIGVGVAKALPLSIVHFAEIDAAHHPTIFKNIHENRIAQERTSVFGGDMFEKSVPPYDFILCNPPYISTSLDRVTESVRKYEPHLALYGGDDGLDLIRTILTQARQQLTATGILFIEHEPEQTEALQKLAFEALLTATTHTDQYNVPRYSRFAVAQ